MFWSQHLLQAQSNFTARKWVISSYLINLWIIRNLQVFLWIWICRCSCAARSDPKGVCLVGYDKTTEWQANTKGLICISWRFNSEFAVSDHSIVHHFINHWLHILRLFQSLDREFEEAKWINFHCSLWVIVLWHFEGSQREFISTEEMSSRCYMFMHSLFKSFELPGGKPLPIHSQYRESIIVFSSSTCGYMHLNAHAKCIQQPEEMHIIYTSKHLSFASRQEAL